MKKSIELLEDLGLTYYTQRHLQTVEKFIEAKGSDLKSLLDELGAWDENDLKITENWYKTL